MVPLPSLGTGVMQSRQGFLTSHVIPHTRTRLAGQESGTLLHEAEVFTEDRLDLSALPEALAPPTDNLPQRSTVITYTVQPGDTVSDIAVKFDISADTVLWANGKLEDNPDLLAVGQELLILPVSGVYHIVAPGETLEDIAAMYKVEPSAIIEFPLNNLAESAELSVGQELIVPGGRKPYVPRRVYAYSGPIPEDAASGTGAFGWPTSGVITQKYWNRHKAIDIGAPKGNSVLAADSGYVIGVGRSDKGYGLHVVIDHRNGFQTLYAHMSVYYVEVGQSVKKGQLIGKVGDTGKATGPHLHFEIVYRGVRRNPFGYLP
jgi:murein DD-endopeptidase MepM/ murein hydrolase activator NlpD